MGTCLNWINFLLQIDQQNFDFSYCQPQLCFWFMKMTCQMDSYHCFANDILIEIRALGLLKCLCRSNTHMSLKQNQYLLLSDQLLIATVKKNYM